MNTQKLISQLQSRIADRKWEIAMNWSFYHMYAEYCEGKDRHRNRANDLGKNQKLDKQLLKVLQSPFDKGYAVGFNEACVAMKYTLEHCECNH